ncbi:hypothetical protein E3N88_45388 [Mikania micrantha]|uniref:Uncharacterized protein n=1 Tax=Mikania micrantha TaxID=192012 RepID=A0A5N6L9K6_9ASTR|nr:hypothetical protein E3N88_45388 [Mikania micrantha]
MMGIRRNRSWLKNRSRKNGFFVILKKREKTGKWGCDRRHGKLQWRCDCYVFDESPERTKLTEWSEANDADGDDDSGSVRGDVVNVVESTGSLVQEDCVKSVDVEHVASSAIDVGEVKVDEEDEVFDDDWQWIETTELERCFGAAVAYMNFKINAGRVNLIDNDVKIQ